MGMLLLTGVFRMAFLLTTYYWDSLYPANCCDYARICHYSSSPSLHLFIHKGNTQCCETLQYKRDCETSHFMLPWLLCAHMLEDYGRPFKHPGDEIIHALWAMYWHRKHCALSCPLGLIIMKSLVKVRSASLRDRLTAALTVKCCSELNCWTLGHYDQLFYLSSKTSTFLGTSHH